MLVLSRCQSELIRIGPSIVVTVVRIGPHSVRLGIDAPRDVMITRGELDITTAEPGESNPASILAYGSAGTCRLLTDALRERRGEDDEDLAKEIERLGADFTRLAELADAMLRAREE